MYTSFVLSMMSSGKCIYSSNPHFFQNWLFPMCRNFSQATFQSVSTPLFTRGKHWSNYEHHRSGVPKPRDADWYQSAACEEPGRTAGVERRASEGSFVCRSPSLPFAPHRSHSRLNHSRPPHPPVGGKIVFHETLFPGAKKVGDGCHR